MRPTPLSTYFCEKWEINSALQFKNRSIHPTNSCMTDIKFYFVSTFLLFSRSNSSNFIIVRIVRSIPSIFEIVFIYFFFNFQHFAFNFCYFSRVLVNLWSTKKNNLIKGWVESSLTAADLLQCEFRLSPFLSVRFFFSSVCLSLLPLLSKLPTLFLPRSVCVLSISLLLFAIVQFFFVSS